MSANNGGREVGGASHDVDSASTLGRWATFFRACLFAAFLVINALVLLVAPFISYNIKRPLLLPNPVLLLPGLVGIVLWVWAFSRGRSGRPRASESSNAGVHGSAGDGRGGLWAARHIVALTLTLAAAQVWLVSVYRFSTGWDVRMVSEAAWQLAQGTQLDESTVTYFQIYPNNLLLLWVSTLCMRAAIALGATSFASGEMVFAVINCLVQALAALALYATLTRLLDRRYALAGWSVLEAICLLSPWVSIPYSDALALGVPPLIAWCYVEASEGDGFGHSALKPACVAVACGFVGIVGYKLKPQTSFLLIAIVLVEFLMLISDAVRGLRSVLSGAGWEGMASSCISSVVQCSDGGFAARRVVASHVGRLVCLAVGCLFAFTVTGAACSSLGIPRNDEQALGPAHFLMMGANNVSDGGYLTEDVAYSLSFADKGERAHVDFERWVERMETYGPMGFARHSVRKALSVYSDGSFSWGAEGGFYKGLEEEAAESGRVTEAEVEAAAAAASDASHPIDRYAVGGGYTRTVRGLILSVITSISKRGTMWWMVEQMLWLPVLLLVTCAGLKVRRDPRPHLGEAPEGGSTRAGSVVSRPAALALVVAMLGLVAFEFLFEARARYLYSSLSLFVMLAMAGLDNLTRLVRERRALTQHAAVGSSPRHQ